MKVFGEINHLESKQKTVNIAPHECFKYIPCLSYIIVIFSTVETLNRVKKRYLTLLCVNICWWLLCWYVMW